MTDERGTNDLEVDKARLRHDLERLQEEYNNYKIMKEVE